MRSVSQSIVSERRVEVGFEKAGQKRVRQGR